MKCCRITICLALSFVCGCTREGGPDSEPNLYIAEFTNGTLETAYECRFASGNQTGCRVSRYFKISNAWVRCSGRMPWKDGISLLDIARQVRFQENLNPPLLREPPAEVQYLVLTDSIYHSYYIICAPTSQYGRTHVTRMTNALYKLDWWPPVPQPQLMKTNMVDFIRCATSTHVNVRQMD